MIVPHREEKKQTKYYCRIKLKQNILYKNHINLLEVKRRIENVFEDVDCIFSPLSIGELVLIFLLLVRIRKEIRRQQNFLFQFFSATLCYQTFRSTSLWYP